MTENSQKKHRSRPHRRAELAGTAASFSDDLPRALLVLGMHRSGTSAVTRILSLLGADLPKTLMGPSPFNETGHWESQGLMEIHTRILLSAGSEWFDWRKFNPDWYRSPLAADFKQRLVAQLRKDYNGSRLFVVKDPRICRFVPLWLDVLAEFPASPAIVLPLRNPLEVSASLKRRDAMLSTKGLLLWLRHVLDAEASTRGLPRAIAPYDVLVKELGRLRQQFVATAEYRLAAPFRDCRYRN